MKPLGADGGIVGPRGEPTPPAPPARELVRAGIGRGGKARFAPSCRIASAFALNLRAENSQVARQPSPPETTTTREPELCVRVGGGKGRGAYRAIASAISAIIRLSQNSPPCTTTCAA